MLAAPTVEPLSLATFEPDRTYAPYLNTPRSLEACRLNGVNPIELVELPISEFQKDFPNDPDAAQRRFERIDGARRRLLAAVKADWKHLCDINWTPNPSRPKSAKEAILDVPVHSHCTLLEIQAAKFRKLEMENYKALQRMLKIEMKKADAEVKGKLIIEKHEELQENNDNLKKDREERKRIAIHEMMERQRKKEEDFIRETKMLQELDAEYAKKMAQDKAAKLLEEKERRERCEMERQQRSEFTRHMKDSIIDAIENKIETRKKTLELRDKSVEERIKEAKELTSKQKADRAKEIEDRLKKAKEEVMRKEEEDRILTMQKMRANEEYRQKIIESRNNQRREQNSNSMNEHLERIRKIKEDTERSLEEKAWRIRKEMEFKEELAKQELSKVKEAQDKRKCIKSIKQESFDMSLMRARKAHEYKMAKLQKEIQDKDIRSNAIKKGFQVLNQMRSSMKDIVYSTTLILKEEMHRLKHKDDFRPERVVEKALAVSKSALFPRLENTFGIEKPPDDEPPLTSSDIFAFDFSDPSALEKADEFLKSTEEDPKEKAARDETIRLRNGPKIDPSLYRLDRTDLPIPRKGFATMQISSFTADKLAESLTDAKEKLLDSNQEMESPYRRTATPSNRGQTSASGDDRSAFSDDEDDWNYKEAKQPVDGNKTSKSKARDSKPSKAHSSYTAPSSNGAATPKIDEGFKASGPQSNTRSATAPAIKQRPLSGKKTLEPLPPRQVQQRRNDDDVQLPMFPFNPLGMDNGANSPAIGGENNQQMPPSENSSRTGKTPNSNTNSKMSAAKQKKIRTDVNEKANFLEPPVGKFRREFSLDHPLAAGGGGKYDEELKKGLKPTGLPSETVKAYSSVSSAIDISNKVERLTFAAQAKVVDPGSELEKIKKAQKEILKKVLDEEREAEERRQEVGNSITDPEEKQHLEHVFAEERKRANDRIIQATRTHETTIKMAVLNMMNLGAKQ